MEEKSQRETMPKSNIKKTTRNKEDVIEKNTIDGANPKVRKRRPVEGGAPRPTGRPAQAPTGRPAQAPAERPAQAPAGRPAQAPAGRPTQAPAGRPAQVPAGRPAQAPAGRPAQVPAGRPTQAPAGRPAQAPAGRPAQAPAGRPVQAPLNQGQNSENPTRKRVPTSGSQEMKVRSARNKKKRTGCLVGVIALLILAVIGAIGASLYLEKYGLSDEEMDTTEYYQISNDTDLALILDNQVLGVGGMVVDDTPYISMDTITESLNSRFYWDESQNSLLYTLEDGTIEASLGENQYSKGNEVTQTEYTIVKTVGSEVYVAVEYVQIYTNIEYKLYKNPYRLTITSEWGDVETVTAKQDTEVRYQAGVKSEILSYVSKGDTLIYLNEDADIEDWTKVCTEDGYVGYVQDKKIGDVESDTISRDFEEQVYTNIALDYTVNLAWHQVTSSEANDTLLTTIANTSGLTTIAPTWFFISSTDGEVTSLASETYVNYAHQLGIEVWAVLNDFDGGMNSQAETYEVLSNATAREKIINTVVAEAIRTGIDGINVDIENVSTETGVHYIQFIRELSVKCRQNGLILSIDNYPPKSYNMHFDYEEQGIVADYVIIMGYDEHYSGSLEAGSVSSISYVQDGITEMLTMVSADKIISGIPFYTRLWEITPKTTAELAEQEGTEEANYPYNVSSQAYGMSSAASLVIDAGVTAEWDEETMQYYATWTVDDTIYEIWLEDSESIEAKLQLMEHYNLAGTAAWKLGFEDASIWSTIEKYVK